MKRISGESPTIRLYRELLGVGPQAGSEELKKAYYRLAMLYHPDRNLNRDTSETFQKIREAFETLSDPVQVRAMQQSYWREKLFNTVVEGLNVSFGSFFGYRVFAPEGSRVEKRFRLGEERAGESDVNGFDQIAGTVEQDQSILDNPAYDAIETVYAGRFSIDDEERLQSGLSSAQMVRLPWVMLNNQGIMHFLDSDIQGALRCYRELNDRVPNNIIFMYRLGLCHVLQGFANSTRGLFGRTRPDRGEVEKGILLFRQCIKIGENRSVGKQHCLLIRKFLADTLAKMGRRRQATRVWRDILRLDPNSVEASFQIQGLAAAKLKLQDRMRARTRARAAEAALKNERLLKGRRD
ncbi:MAG: DnaJ domain-containing protein [Bdellovibrionales bacterium]